MGLTGLDVYKLLPRTNCKKCGIATCLAFAMQVASGKISVEACPDVAEEVKERLLSQSRPPMKLIHAGRADAAIALGGETVMFRHDKTFVSAPPVFIDVGTSDSPHLAASVACVAAHKYERVGQAYRVNGFAVGVGHTDGVSTALALGEQHSLLPLLLASEPSILSGMEEHLRKSKPIIGCLGPDATGTVARVAAEAGCVLIVSGDTLESLRANVKQAEAKGAKDLLLRVDAASRPETLANLVGVRRAALLNRDALLGYPTIVFINGTETEQLGTAVAFMARYAGAMVVGNLSRESMLSLLTWRQDLYSDPQRPIQVESRLYEVGDVGPESPLYITTNFSLTYYSVETEVSASRVPAFILPVDTDGTSVLTAWAAGKYGADRISDAIHSSGAPQRCASRVAVIPGHVAQLAPALRERSGFQILVGPEEASGIPKFARATFGAGRAR